jgi:hypothetical protein
MQAQAMLQAASPGLPEQHHIFLALLLRAYAMTWTMSLPCVIMINLHNDASVDHVMMILNGVSGLCHDLGHGPFSHVFEHELLPRIVGKKEAKQW